MRPEWLSVIDIWAQVCIAQRLRQFDRQYHASFPWSPRDRGKASWPATCEYISSPDMQIEFHKDRSVNQESLKALSQASSWTTKQEIVIAVSMIFPELQWKLPPPRKSWQPENW